MIGQEEINLVIGLTPFLRPNPVIFDGGANKGHWMDIMLNEYGDNCTIHAFEPVHKLINFLEIKYEYKTNISFVEMAISDFNGETNFYYFENFNNELSSLHKQDWWENELPMKRNTVHAVKIDTYCKIHGIECIDYLKLDLEGNEPQALEGCEEMLQNNKIRIIQIEYGSTYKTSNKTFADVIKFANHYGYSVYSFENSNYNKVELATFIEDFHPENYIITKEEIHNYTDDSGNWLSAFKESVEGLPKSNFLLEIGSYEGLTARYMCENMLAEGGRMIVIDPLKDYYTEDTKDVYPYFKGQYQRFLRNTRGLPIELRRNESRVELPTMLAFRFSFSYIDGNHNGYHVYHDGCDVFKMTQINGFILFDDAFGWSEDTSSGVEKFLREHEGRYETIKRGYQLLIQKTKD